jgi:hypothetical protein
LLIILAHFWMLRRLGLYRTPSEFTGRYVARCGYKYGITPGVETPITPDGLGDSTVVMGWKGFGVPMPQSRIYSILAAI